MIRKPREAAKFPGICRSAAAFLCLTIGVPMSARAQSQPIVVAGEAPDALPPAAAVQAGQASQIQASQTSVRTPERLTEEEMNSLSARNQDPGTNVRGGSFSNEHL